MALDETKRVRAKEDETGFYLKVLEAIPTEEVIFKETDKIEALTDAGEYGISVATKETEYVHKKTTTKTRGKKSYKDISLTEAMFYEQLKEREAQCDDGSLIALGSFTVDKECIYAYCGTINDFTGSFTGEAGTVKYTYSPDTKIDARVEDAEA